MKPKIRNFVIKLAWTILFLIAWKSISTDWIVEIPKQSGGFLMYYPENSPAWIPPNPKAEYSSFEKQITLEFGSGSGPFLVSEATKISWNWQLIMIKIFVPLLISSIFYAIQARRKLEVSKAQRSSNKY